jgi:hypothetical protein
VSAADRYVAGYSEAYFADRWGDRGTKVHAVDPHKYPGSEGSSGVGMCGVAVRTSKATPWGLFTESRRCKRCQRAITAAQRTVPPQLRKHMAERHIGHRLPRANADVARLHARLHHQRRLSHDHGPNPNLGPNSRPDGWRTGGHVVERVPPAT